MGDRGDAGAAGDGQAEARMAGVVCPLDVDGVAGLGRAADRGGTVDAAAATACTVFCRPPNLVTPSPESAPGLSGVVVALQRLHRADSWAM